MPFGLFSFGQSHLKFGHTGRGVLLVDDVYHLFHHIGVLRCHIVVFVEVLAQVVETAVATLHHQFPVAHTHAHHVGFVKFPIKMIVLLLLVVLAHEGVVERESVVEVLVVTLIGFGEILDACHIAEGGQHIVERQLVVVHFACCHLAGPAHDEGDADAPLVGGAFQALEQPIAIEEGGIGTALFVRTIVGGEDYDGVFVHALRFEFRDDFAHHEVQARDHSSKLSVCLFGAVIAVAHLAAEDVLLAEVVLIRLQQTVVGLLQFGVGQGIGEDAQEGLIFGLFVEPSHRLLVDKVGRILRTFQIVFAAGHTIFNVLLERHTVGLFVATRTAKFVQEIGIIGMSFKLADVAIIFVDAALVGRRSRTLITACPFAKHPRGVAIGFEDFGQNLVVHIIGFLSCPALCKVSVFAIKIRHILSAPVFLVAAHVGVSAVLSSHEGGTRGSRHWTSGISLCEAHAFGCHAVEIGGSDVLLTIASQVAIAHVVAHDVDDVGTLLRMTSHGCQSTKSEESICFFHNENAECWMPAYEPRALLDTDI